MHPSQRPPTTTSWVQMSAAGASPLAAAAASHANRRTNLPSATSTGQTNSSSNPLMGECTSAMTASQRGGPFLDPITSSGGGGTDQDQTGSARLSFISTSSTSSAASSSVASISSSASHQHPQYQFGSALQTSAGSRLASVLGASSGGGPSTGTNSLLSSSSTTSSSASASGVGPAGAQAALGLAGSASAVATTATGSTTSSFQSCAGGGATTNEPSLLSMSLSATPSQQLQAAMGELHLAEQQLLLGGAGVGDPLHYHDQNAMADHQEAQQREAARKLRLQLYVFVLRCISYPFNAKQQATGDHRQQQLKLRKAQLEQIVQAHARFMRSSSFSGCAAAVGGGGGETGSASLASAAHLQHLGKVLTESQMKQLLELQERAHASFERRVLQNERMRLLVEAECCSQQDLRDLFRQNAERILKESQLFITAHQQQRQHQHQQQRANLMGGGVSQMGQTGGQGSSSTGRGGGTGSGGARSPQSVQQEQQQASDYSQQAYVQLLNNREAILNAWLIGFESAIRHSDDSAGSLDGGSSTSSALGTLGAAASRGTLAASGPSLASNLSAAGTASPSDQAQQQQQMSKEQLYQMFQSILNIKKFEHQLLYNALQLDSSDEQAAAIRRELDGRVARIAELERNKKLLPKFVLKEMESLYLEETRMAVNKLMVNLDSLPVIKSSSHQTGESRGVYSGLQKFRRYNSRTQASLTRDGLAESHPSEPQLSKLDVVLSFNIEVIVMEVRGLRNISSNREIYCTMEIEGSETGRLQTEHVLAKKPLWDTQGDFVTNHPLPILKIKLYAVNPSMLSLEDKELGKLVLRPSVLSPKTPEWCTMLATSGSDKFQSGKDSASGGGGANNGGSGGPGSDSSPLAAGSEQQSGGGDQLKIRVIVRMDRPQQLKHCGFLYGVGKSTWRKFRRRYHILIQVSQYTFVMCDFREKKSKPNEMLQLDGYTVDYIEPPTDLIMEHCSEITSNEHAHHHHHHGGQHHSSGSSGTFGLAGRLAKPFLKSQQSPLSSLVGGGGAGGSGAGSGGSAAAFADDPSGVIGLDSSSGQEQSQPSAIQTAAALSDELHNKFYFNVVKEGDSVVFACDDEQECFGWVMALYRATGQAHKPTPLRDQYSSSASSTHYIDAAFAYNASASGREQTKLVGAASPSSASSLLLSSMLNGSGSSSVVGSSCSTSGGATGVGGGGVGGGGSSSNALMLSKSSVDVANQRARKHGMDEFISADPCKFQHNQLFKHLQDETLRFRLNDQYLSLGWFSSGQLFVLDEYCARYGVRTCFRHLSYLNSLLDFNVRGYFIDHTLINYGYDFCSSFVSGQSGQLNPMSSVNFDLRPDGTVGTVTVEERDLFHSVKQKLLKMIERQLANFPYCFPYGKPDGALKSTLSLLERVLMKQESAANQMSSMLQNDEVRNLIRKCLEQAALNNYTKLSGQANLLLPPAASGPTSCGSSVNQQGRRQLLNGQQQSTESNPSGQSSPSCSPQPQQLSDPFEGPGSAGSNTTGGGSFLIRKRTQSNLSGGGVSSSNGSSSNYSPNASMRGSHQRFTNQDQQQQPQCITMAMIINHDQVKPQEKLRYLIRLAELCCEQVEENNEYFADAFAWHSDLMTDHFELFWSLFSVDMDKVLAELNGQTGQPTNQQGNQQQQSGIVAAVAMPLGRTISSSSGGVAQQGGTTAGTGQAGQGGHCASISSASGQSSDLLGVNNRDIFALFQVLNNHMRKPTNTFECRKFRAYLCDTFKPKLLRYIDIMESTLTRMVFKACEKEGQVNCRLIEQMFVRLDELQVFVLKQLRWPDEQLAEQLHQRLKLIAYELCDAIVQRTLLAFQQLEKRSNKWTTTTTSYNSPVEMIQMINLTLDTRNRSLKLCTFNGFDQMSYHSKIDKLIESALGEMQPGLMAKMLNALDSTLNKLARFDEGNLLAPILSLTYKQGMSSSGRDIGKQYVSFVSNCCDLIRHKINDEIWIVSLLEDWYAAQMNTICGWLAERIDRSLHDVQLVALANIMPKIYADMSLQGVSEDKLNLKSYQTIMSRLKMEEASSLAGGTLFEQPSTSSSIFNTSLLSSLTSSSSSSSSVATGGPVSLGGGQSTTGGATGSAQQPSTPQQLQQQQQQYQLGHQHMGQLRPQSSGGSLGSGQQQQQQQQFMSNAPGTPVWRTGNVSSINGPPSSGQLGGGEQRTDEQGDNIADRALQSATRMFKGFWN